jgi:hypothetical protein
MSAQHGRVVRPRRAADTALDWRDRALAALDEGNPARALSLAARALSTLEEAGLRWPETRWAARWPAGGRRAGR